ncbi:leukocyte-associated immunoglobulin-like receptor 1 isoform X2 [Trachypithecus francoisi]|uniref:leukocyte-associated immunoglobulin-like receptor 1 isoform X2 n=1 Tax=Trachypithecus francoisi TaxID=54180 RepID=UPI00141B9BEC|nr:leukocyte-associated immunoglobulin-like receptor 1 isoform X2 [Trachypithecus francoisi]XP_033085092.1 leukocyte-associated immunoglobulin-like receptor 1 isoform X2 [Trachypithecus francoisi]
MSPHPTALLGLVLCLAQTIHTQEGPLPRPSISAEPGTEIPLGRPVTFVCRSPVGVQTFRLEREGRSEFNDTNDVSQASPFESEARFRIDSVSEANAGLYRCIYYKTPRWSEHSDYLELVVKGPTQRPSDNSHNEHAPASQGLSAEHLYILIGVSVVFLFCLLLLVLFLLHRQNQIKQGPPRSKDEKQKLQQRPDLAVDVLERTADKATVNGLPEKDRETDNLAPAAGSSQEVTYAQLDHWALTRRTAQAGSPQSTEPMAESSTYAAVARH